MRRTDEVGAESEPVEDAGAEGDEADGVERDIGVHRYWCVVVHSGWSGSGSPAVRSGEVHVWCGAAVVVLQ